MADVVKKLAIETRETPEEIWDSCRTQFETEANGLPYAALTCEQAKNLVSNTRKKLSGGDSIRAMESFKFSTIDEIDGSFFLQFNILRPLQWKKSLPLKLTRILGFANPQLLGLLRDKNVSCYFDGTFDCTPLPFKQTLILMVKDNRTASYVPVFYILLEGKSEHVYKAALKQILLEQESFTPGEIHCDFERGLINAIQCVFPKSPIVGCLFHFKQAIHRKLKELAISSEEIVFFMRPGMLDILTLIPPEEIVTFGIPYVRSGFISLPMY